MRFPTFAAIISILVFLPILPLPAQEGLEAIGPDTDCFMCHGNRDLTKELPEGRKFSMHVDKGEWKKSAHAQLGCQVCHGERPHPTADQIDTLAEWRRYQTELSEACGGCHAEQGEAFSGSVHAVSNDPNAPNTCVGCHNPHEAGISTRTKQGAVDVCSGCHTESRRTYMLSVHGQNLALGNENAAACFDCHRYHNVHRVEEFTNARLVDICSNCHKGVTEKSVAGWFSHAPITGVQRVILDATKLFYLIIIPLTIGSMIAHQFLRHRRTMAERRRTREDNE